MMNGLVEKLIISSFGDYIENLDKNKLSVAVWSGILVLEDILIKSKAINDFKLPFKMIYGKINKMSVSIPWKNNFTTPTVITIEGVQIFLSMIKQEQWEFIDYISYEAKLKKLLSFANERLFQLSETFNKQKEESKSSSGYLDKLMIKVLDNLHINFKNINIRLEDSTKAICHSLGITLEEMFIVNTDENWEQKFIDRNVHKNINVFKLLKISNFGLYLKCNDSFSLGSLPNNKISEEMLKQFPPNTSQAVNVDYLIKPISLTAKLKQNNEIKINNAKQVDVVGKEARLSISINLTTFDIKLLKSQFDYLIRLMNGISSYQRFQYHYQNTARFRFFRPKYKIMDKTNKMEYQSKDVKNPNAVGWWQYSIRMMLKMRKYHKGKTDVFLIPQKTYNQYQKDYTELFPLFYKKTKYNQSRMNEIVEFADLKDLYKWTKPILQTLFQEQKKGNKPSTFIQKKIEEAITLTEEEQKTIEEILDNAVNEETTLIMNDLLETKTQIDFLLQNGSFKFIKQKNTIIEGFAVKYENLFFSMKNGIHFSDLQSELKELNIYMITIINNNLISVPITFNELNEDSLGSSLNTKKTDNNTVAPVNQSNYFWKFHIRKNNPKDAINSTLFFQINELNIAYHQVLFERILSFFNVQVDEDIANKAWDKLTTFKSSTQQTIKANIYKKNIIEVNIAKRQLIIPINKYDIKNTKVLLINMGDIQIKTTTNIDHKVIDINLYHEHCLMKLESFSIGYYKSFKDIINSVNRFDIITDLSASVYISLLNSTESNKKHPQIMIMVEIHNFIMNITAYLFALLVYIIEILRPTKEVDYWSQVNTDMEEIKANAKIIERVKKKNNVYFTWEEFYLVLSNGYLYFYNSLDDAEYLGYYYLKDTEITLEPNDLLAIQLTNKYGSMELMFSEEESFLRWLTNVNERMNEMKLSAYDDSESVLNNEEIQGSEERVNSTIDPSTLIIGGHFQLNKSSICFFHDQDNLKKFSTLSIKEVVIDGTMRQYDYSFSLGITGAYFTDEECIIKEYKHIIHSNNVDSVRLVNMTINLTDEHSDKFDSNRITVDLHFGSLNVNWNPIFLRKIVSYCVHNDILKNKIKREILIQNEQLLEKNFLQAGKEEEVIKYKCNEHQYALYKITAQFKEVEIIWIQPILNIKFSQILLKETHLEGFIKVDHLELKGRLMDIEIYDLTQYPFVLEDNSFLPNEKIRKIIFSKDNSSTNNSSLPFMSFDFMSMFTWCPNCKDNFLSQVTVKFNNPLLIYIHEHFIRCFNYFTKEFLSVLKKNEEVMQFLNQLYKLQPKEEKDIDFMRMNVIICEPKIIIKPRYQFKEYFIANINKITLSSYYRKVVGKIRDKPEEYRWNTTYHFSLDQFIIKTSDDFNICSPVNGIVNLHICEYTDSDKLHYSVLQFNYSYQIDLWINETCLNMRQKDFTNILRCLDLNVLYTDEKECFYDYLQVKIPTANEIKDDAENKKKMIDIINDMLVFLFLPKVKVKLYLDNGQPFCEVLIQETIIDCVRSLSLTKTANINVADIEAYLLINKRKEKILCDHIPYETYQDFIDKYYSFISSGVIIQPTLVNQINTKGKTQGQLKVIIDILRQKSVTISMTGFKLLFSNNIIEYIRFFFLEGLPFYNKNDRDFPNGFDPNEENNPTLTLLIEIKKPLICFFTDTIENTSQDLICISSEVIIGAKYEQISKIKNDLNQRYITLNQSIIEEINQRKKDELYSEIMNDKGFINSLNVSFFEICPFVVGMKDILNKEAKAYVPSSRKIMDNFLLCYEDKTQIQFIPPSNYVVSNVNKINMNKVTVKASYTDIVLVLKMSDYYMSLMTSDYEKTLESLKVYSKSKKQADAINEKDELTYSKSESVQLIMTDHNMLNSSNSICFQSNDTSRTQFLKQKETLINKGIGLMELKTQGIQIILIDDHAHTFYPFISFYLKDFTASSESINKTQTLFNIDIAIKAHSYNYIAGIWEPLIEETKFKLEISKDTSDEYNHSFAYHLRTLSLFNINISDLTISFLTMTLSGWIEKYKKFKENKSPLLIIEQNMKITNHTVFNYTGCPLSIYRYSKVDQVKQALLAEIKENDLYEIEYFVDESDEDVQMRNLMSNLMSENFIYFELDKGQTIVKNNQLKIDNVQSKKYQIDSRKDGTLINKGGIFDYLISKIDFKKMKKFIYFYSPLSFKNKTEINFQLISNNNNKKNLKQLNLIIHSKKTIGIPYEFLDGTIEISMNTNPNDSIKSSKKFMIKSFLHDGQILEELKFNNNIFINLFHPKSPIIKEKIIRMRVSYSIHNCLPFDIQVILNEQNQMYSIEKSGKVFISCLSMKKNLNIYLYFNSFSTKKEVTLYNVKEPKETISIPLVDRDNHTLTIYASLLNEDSKILVLYASNAIINHTGLALKFFYGKNEKKTIEIANQKDMNNFFLLNEEKHIFIQHMNYVSHIISITAIGTSSIIELINEETLHKIEFIMEISLSLLTMELDLYTTIISFIPRFIVYNKLSYEINVINEKYTQSYTLVESEQKCPLYHCYDNDNDNDRLAFQPTEQDNKQNPIWKPSSAISILFGVLTTLKLYSNDSKQKRFINIEKKIDHLTTYITLTPADIKTAQIIIKNHSETVSFKAFQLCHENQCDYMHPLSKSIFAWSNSLELNIVCLQFILNDIIILSAKRSYELLDEKVIISGPKNKREQKYPMTDYIKVKTSLNCGQVIKVIIKSSGSKYEISVWDYIQSYSKEVIPRCKEIEMNIYIEEMGISLIGDNRNIEKKREKEKYNRNEICYVSFDEIVFYSKSVINPLSADTELQLIIKEMEIDNEISYLKNFPILLLPSAHRNHPNQKIINTELTDQQISVQPFFNCAIFMQKNQSENFTRIPLFNYLIQAFTFNMESNVLVGLINFFRNIAIDMKTSISTINPIFNSNKENQVKGITIKDSYFMSEWITKTNLNQTETLFIQKFNASSLEILLSFINQTKDKVFQHLLQSNRILASLLSTISNIEKVPLKLNGCELNNFSGDWNDIIRNILYIYQQNMLVQIMKLFGAIDILGNPLHLMNSLGKGFKDLFEKPAKGIMKGPLQGAIGLVDGTLSLAKHTIDSTLNSTSKITSGISKGMLMITQDDEYINEREKKKITERPKNVIEGIGYGLSSMAGGLFFGVTDIVKKPIQGARKGKLKGFGKGVLIGLGGAIIKPISGVFDLVSKTTEGIKNTVSNEANLKPKRIARPFYGKDKIIKDYNISHAQVIELLSTKIDKVKNTVFDFYSCEIYQNAKEDSILLVFLSNGIFTIDLLKKELKSVLEYGDIKEVMIDDSDKIIITFKKELHKKMYTSMSLSNNYSDHKKLVDKIKEAIDNNYEENVI